jgi:hypothetical protein
MAPVIHPGQVSALAEGFCDSQVFVGFILIIDNSDACVMIITKIKLDSM